MRHDTRATYFKAHLYSPECRKYTNLLLSGKTFLGKIN